MTLTEAAALANIKARRASVDDLLVELKQRCEDLGPMVLDTPERQRVIAEVVAPFRLKPFELFLIGDQCRTYEDQEIGRTLTFTGFLADLSVSQAVGLIKRELLLDQKSAVHHFLEIQNQYRSKAMALVLLDRGFEFYRSLGFESVLIETGRASGRWYWARCGFDFDPSQPEVRERLERWYQQVIDAFGYKPASPPQRAQDWALLGTEKRGFLASFAELDEKITGKRVRLEEVAHANHIEWTQRIEIGRLAMLSGTEWPGVFDLRDDVLKASFDAHLMERVQELQRDARSVEEP
jgi:hypothetical protein